MLNDNWLQLMPLSIGIMINLDSYFMADDEIDLDVKNQILLRHQDRFHHQP